MPQLDVQWPSEDEDFDAKSDSSPAKQAGKRSKSLKVADQPSEQAPAEPEAANNDHNDPEPEQEAEEPAQEAAADAQPEQSEPADQDEADSQDNQPDSDPAVQEEAANLASTADEPLPADATVATASSPKSSKMPRLNMGVLRLVGEGVLVVAVVLLGVYAWKLSSDRNSLQSQVDSLNSNPQSAVQKQTQQLITRVGHLITLPSGETPTVAEVSDAAQAKQQSSFFNNAQNGDRVLMYVKAGEAILYRPSTNKIILVAPLVFTNNGTSGTTGTSTTSSTNKTTDTGTTSTTKTSTGH